MGKRVSDFDSAYEYVEDNYDPEDYETFDEYLEDIRGDFNNEGLMDAIEDGLRDIYESSQG